jgi:hypothetical protein
LRELAEAEPISTNRASNESSYHSDGGQGVGRAILADLRIVLEPASILV